MDDRFLGAVLTTLARPDAADIALCDTVVAQCLDALPTAIKVMSADGRIVFYNRAAYRYFGPRIVWARWPHERDDLFHHDDLPARTIAREKVLRRGLNVKVELRAIRFDYVPRWHLFDLTPLFDKSQKVTGMMIGMTDIHDTDRAG